MNMMDRLIYLLEFLSQKILKIWDISLFLS